MFKILQPTHSLTPQCKPREGDEAEISIPALQRRGLQESQGCPAALNFWKDKLAAPCFLQARTWVEPGEVVYAYYHST